MTIIRHALSLRRDASALLPPEEVVEDEAAHGKEDDEKCPQDLVAAASRATRKLQQCDDVENHDHDAAAAQRPEVAHTIEKVRAATGEEDRRRENEYHGKRAMGCSLHQHLQSEGDVGCRKITRRANAVECW